MVDVGWWYQKLAIYYYYKGNAGMRTSLYSMYEKPKKYFWGHKEVPFLLYGIKHNPKVIIYYLLFIMGTWEVGVCGMSNKIAISFLVLFRIWIWIRCFLHWVYRRGNDCNKDVALREPQFIACTVSTLHRHKVNLPLLKVHRRIRTQNLDNLFRKRSSNMLYKHHKFGIWDVHTLKGKNPLLLAYSA